MTQFIMKLSICFRYQTLFKNWSFHSMIHTSLLLVHQDMFIASVSMSQCITRITTTKNLMNTNKTVSTIVSLMIIKSMDYQSKKHRKMVHQHKVTYLLGQQPKNIWFFTKISVEIWLLSSQLLNVISPLFYYVRFKASC